jgi:probable F420-dependent oxidoreductase
MGAKHTFRFGVQCGGQHDGASWRALARQLEDLGYSTLYMPDHFIDTVLAPLPAMAIAAEATTTLRVGALVYDNDYKHPAILAKETATIDVLSGGRAELGIGAGWMKVDYEALGIPYDSAGTRIARLEEGLAVIKGCFTGEPFSFSGEHYTISDYTAIPKPVQAGGVPILIGGGAPKILGLAGREADIIGINPNLRVGAITADAAKTANAEETARKIEWIKAGAGERFDDIELQIRYFVHAITDDRESFAAAVAGAFDATATDVLGSGAALIGTIPEMVDTLQQRREEWGVTYVVVGNDFCEQFAPVVAQLAGT